MSQLQLKIMTLTQGYQMILLQPEGPLDLQNGKVLKEQLAGLVPQLQDLWVIDLASVDFMDSNGLVALVTGLLAARQSGCRLVVCNVQAPVRIIFELTQLDEVFEIFESYDAVLTTVEVPVLVA
jgi:anti-anti-sigma factor